MALDKGVGERMRRLRLREKEMGRNASALLRSELSAGRASRFFLRLGLPPQLSAADARHPSLFNMAHLPFPPQRAALAPPRVEKLWMPREHTLEDLHELLLQEEKALRKKVSLLVPGNRVHFTVAPNTHKCIPSILDEGG